MTSHEADLSTTASRAGDDGGGLYANTFAGSATVTLTHVTIANNRAKDQGANLRRAGGTLALVNTIVADRVGSGVSCSGTITSLGHNLADEGSCGLSQPGDQTTTFDLAPLGHHGGPTMTHPLVPADPGVDAADVTHSPNTDQRGARRDNASPYANVGTAPDIGAFEAGGFPGQGVPAIAGTLAQGEITYDHLIDGEGRRLETTSTLTADVLRSWWDPLGAPGQLATETDGQGNPIRTYLYGAGLISVLTPFATLGTHQDHLGSITALSNTQGSPQTQRSYGPFGATKTLEVTNPLTIHVPLAFTAGHEDRGGNYHLQARQYDPGTGRFGGLDPLAQGTTDPVVSAYTYVANRPTVLVDPTGMAGQTGERRYSYFEIFREISALAFGSNAEFHRHKMTSGPYGTGNPDELKPHKGETFKVNWSDDGCSNPEWIFVIALWGDSDYPKGYHFRPACEQHDFGYRNFKDLDKAVQALGTPGGGYWNENRRHRVDDHFHENLKATCKQEGNWLLQPGIPEWFAQSIEKDCRDIAGKYYRAVRLFGEKGVWAITDDILPIIA